MEQTGKTTAAADLYEKISELRNEQEVKKIMQDVKVDTALKALDQALFELRRNKPNDRSDADRYWAIVITDVEKALAVFKTYVR
jgi:hypothetical protein